MLALRVLQEEYNRLKYTLSLFDDFESVENDLDIAEGYKRLKAISDAIQELKEIKIVDNKQENLLNLSKEEALKKLSEELDDFGVVSIYQAERLIKEIYC